MQIEMFSHFAKLEIDLRVVAGFVIINKFSDSKVS